MIDPPSPSLTTALSELHLCAPSDIKRCRRRVRRLARDVPAFDSIWLDALLQARQLTPFQAQILESGRHDRLRVGPCVLVDQLGQGVDATTYLARRREGAEQVVLKLMDRPLETLEADQERLSQLAFRLRNVDHRSVVGPHTALRHGDQLVAISGYVQGLHLGELMIRRGRFPAEIVTDIGNQLLDGLTALEAADCVHGDIRLTNVRLTAAGVAVLVDAGVRPAVTRELTILARVPPDRYDGVAPELIGTGQMATAASDLYAVGCLFWHLLAGRPPFPTGDPLAKLASHQTREVADVREWAPDTPARLAESIRQLTAADPSQRPQTFHEALSGWGGFRRSPRHRLARFRSQFDSGVSTAPSQGVSTSTGLTVLLLLLFVVSGAAVSMFDSGARNQLLRLGALAFDEPHVQPTPVDEGREAGALEEDLPTKPRRIAATEPTPTAERRPLDDLPAPGRDNVIRLEAGLTYEVAEIAGIGTLTIRAPQDKGATILVRDDPLRIWAAKLVLENLTFARPWTTDSASEPAALVLAETQSLTIRNCRFETQSLEVVQTSGDQGSMTSNQTMAIAWKLIDQPDASAGRVEIENSVFMGTRSALFLASAPREIRCQNSLKLGAGPFFTLTAAPQRGADLRMQVDGVTLRAADALLRWKPTVVPQELGRISVEANDCVLDVKGPNAALFQVDTSERLPELLSALECFGEGSLASSELVVARRLNTQDRAWHDVDATHRDAVAVEGILKMSYEFAGDLSDDRRDSLVESHNAPRRHDRPPGIAVDGGDDG